MDALLMNASTATSSKVLVEKRDGRVVDFDPINIISAVKSAFADLDKQVGPEEEKLIRGFADQIEGEITERYNVTYMAIDTGGLGQGVYQLVKQFYPSVVALSYSPEVKGRLVLKGLSVVRGGRLEFDAGWTDLAQSFMAIRKTVTASGRQLTYTAGYSQETGHADLAWATLHALGNEPLEGATSNNTSIMEIYS